MTSKSDPEHQHRTRSDSNLQLAPAVLTYSFIIASASLTQLLSAAFCHLDHYFAGTWMLYRWHIDEALFSPQGLRTLWRPPEGPVTLSPFEYLCIWNGLRFLRRHGWPWTRAGACTAISVLIVSKAGFVTKSKQEPPLPLSNLTRRGNCIWILDQIHQENFSFFPVFCAWVGVGCPTLCRCHVTSTFVHFTWAWLPITSNFGSVFPAPEAFLSSWFLYHLPIPVVLGYVRLPACSNCCR